MPNSSQVVFPVRLAKPADLDAINEIYNHYVLHSTCTYQTEPSTMEERRGWFEAHGPKHPVTVLEADGVVAGWGSLSPLHERYGYRFTVENSVYIREGFHRRGMGQAILADLIRRAGELGYHTIVARISADQEPSVALHRKFGFTEVARIKEVGNKFDRWLDAVYLQLMV